MKIAALPMYTRLVTIAALALAGLVTIGAPSATAAMPPSAAATLARALHDAVTSRGVHEVVTGSNGEIRWVSIDDIGVSSGRQTTGNSVGATQTLIALDAAHKMYERGNVLGVTWFFAIPKAQAGTYANKWLLLTPFTAGYGSTALDTTLKSDFPNHLNLHGPLKFGPLTTVAGVRVRTITGTFPETTSMPQLHATLYVTVTGPVLPVQLRETAVGATFRTTQTWSKWNVPVNLTAPAGAIPFPAPTPAG